MAGVIEVHSPDELAAYMRESAGELRRVADRLDDLAAVFMTAPRITLEAAPAPAGVVLTKELEWLEGAVTASRSRLTPADVGELEDIR